jgi:hypothetical protein
MGISSNEFKQIRQKLQKIEQNFIHVFKQSMAFTAHNSQTQNVILQRGITY